ncbi:MAG: sigma-70 family RNA polymerase sigma factor [Planctomycetes bacterium]|nr:sigma-70 family RNA polymerase sigma factor [Planctomycetota bacterium]
MVASLVRVFGSEHIELAEDVVQESLLRALRIWPFRGIPAEPEAWLMRVARNRALDLLRRDQAFREREAAIAAARSLGVDDEPGRPPDELTDDQLRLMFTCCHPSLAATARVALTLKTVCGFGLSEIARAFLVAEDAIAQRLVRARRDIRDRGIPLGLGGAEDVAARLPSVLEAVYLLFNEGYAAHEGDALLRRDLIEEALRLGALLLREESTRLPEVHALMALMLFQASRSAARVDPAGEILLLEEQDRRSWDRRMIGRAFHELELAMRGDELTRFHLEAGIASCHALPRTWQDTDWRRVLDYYDLLLEIRPDPVVALNRAVALALAEGLERGLEALDGLAREPILRSYYLLPAARAELLRRAGRFAAAAAAFRQALALRASEPERRLLERRLADCERDR